VQLTFLKAANQTLRAGGGSEDNGAESGAIWDSSRQTIPIYLQRRMLSLLFTTHAITFDNKTMLQNH